METYKRFPFALISGQDVFHTADNSINVTHI